MLVLTIWQDESVIIGNDTNITVLNIDEDKIKSGVNDSEGVFLKGQETLPIKDGITAKLVKADKNQVQLGIDAPENVTINREEVYMK